MLYHFKTLQYFFKKENKEKKKANDIYKKIIKSSNIFINENDFFKDKNYNVSFEIVSIFLICHINYNIQNKINNFKIINEYLVSIFISDLDESLREKGIGDMSIGKYVKSYVKKFYFRLSKFPREVDKVNSKTFANYLKIFQIIVDDKHEEASEKILQICENINL